MVNDQMSENERIARLFGRAVNEGYDAMCKHPQPNYVTMKLAEETGEVIKEAVHYYEGRGDWQRVEDECVQVIAMVFRLLMEGDGVLKEANE